MSLYYFSYLKLVIWSNLYTLSELWHIIWMKYSLINVSCSGQVRFFFSKRWRMQNRCQNPIDLQWRKDPSYI